MLRGLTVLLIVHDKFQPTLISRDVHGRFVFVEILYAGEVFWLVGVYAPNNASLCRALWQQLHDLLRVGHLGFLMGDFNMCVDSSQSMSSNGLMDAPKFGLDLLFLRRFYIKIYGPGFILLIMVILFSLLKILIHGVD